MWDALHQESIYDALVRVAFFKDPSGVMNVASTTSMHICHYEKLFGKSLLTCLMVCICYIYVQTLSGNSKIPLP
jgi:hypothetical protein